MNDKDKYNIMLFYMLCAAYIYYDINENVMSDTEYDNLTKDIYNNKDKITHKYKELIDWSSLKKCSSLFYIDWANMPFYFKEQAYIWRELCLTPSNIFL